MPRFIKILPALLLIPLAAFAKPPSVMFVYPAGGKTGSTFKAVIGALDADFANGISISGKGVSAKIISINEMPPERAQAAAKRNEAKGMKFIEAEIKISKDAETGTRDLRLTSAEGASTRYFFEVENLLEILENPTHSSIKTAQKIEKLPAAINGQIYEGDRDFYEFKLEKGKTYVFDLHARKIRPYLADAVPGWFQATMRLYGQDGISLEYVDDFQNSPDPVLIFTPEKTASYFLEIKDALYRGRDDFVYRLRAGELPFIKSIFPCGGNSKEITEVDVDGVNLPSKKLKVSKDAKDLNLKEISLSKNSILSNSVKFEFEDLPEIKAEANLQIPQEPLKIPCVINGIFKSPYDKFQFLIRAKKGEELTFEVLGSRLGYPVDSRLKLVNLKSGKQIAFNDDFDDASFGLITAQFDSRIIHKFATSGDFLLILDEAQNKGADDCVFRLKIAKPKRDLQVLLTHSNPQLPKGNFAPLGISAVKKGGWDGDIEIIAKDLPEGITAEKCVIQKKKNFAFLVLKAKETCNVKNFEPKLFAIAKFGDETREIPVTASEELTQAFFITHTLPIESANVSTLPKAPFRIEWGELPSLPATIGAGNTLELNLKLVRENGFNGNIRITPYKTARGLRLRPITIKPDDPAEFQVFLQANKNLQGVLSDFLYLSATSRKGKNNYIYTAPPIEYKIIGRKQTKFNAK